MASTIRRATPPDVPALVALMTEFYAESGYRLDRDRAGAAFDRLLADDHLGQVWLSELAGDPSGYLVLTLCYSMEFGGLGAWIDDLYVRPAARNGGLAGRLLEAARRSAEAGGVRAIHVEVAADNAPAQRAYRRAGLRPVERQLLTLELAEPTHLR